MSTVIGTNLSKLESSYALEIMSNISKYLKFSIQTAPTSPRAGELYLFVTEETSKKDEWKYDNLKWINNSSRLCHRGNFQIKLHYFTVNIGFRNRGLFFKQVYATQIDDLYISLIYYHGSNDHAINIPHNKLRQLRNNVQVPPAVTYTLPGKQEHREVINSPPILLHSLTEAFSDEVNTKLHQSAQLCNNIQVVEPVPRMDNNTRQLNTLALHHKADQYPNLIYLLTTIPQLTMIFGYNDLIHEFRHLIRTYPFPQEVRLSLDLSFRTDTFYVTPIYINYPVFSDNPFFPVLVLIHEMKTSQAYNSLLSELVELMPELLDENFTFTPDENDLSVNSIKKYLPNANIHTPENLSCCSDHREVMNSLFPSKAIGPIEFIEIMKDHQKDILKEISKSYKSKGKFRIQRQQLTMPATCLQNNFYQILKASEVSIQDIPGFKWHFESSPNQEQEQSVGFSSYVMLEQSSGEDSPLQGSTSPLVADVNHCDVISQSISDDNQVQIQ